MKDLFKLLQIVFEYKRKAFISIFFNILFVIFGLVSVTAVIPFLDVLFTSPSNEKIITYEGKDYVAVDELENYEENINKIYKEQDSIKLNDETKQKKGVLSKYSVSNLLRIAKSFLRGVVEERGARFALLAICIFMIITTLLKTTSRYMSLYFLAPVRNGVMKSLRNNIFAKILKLPLSYYSEERKGDIIARMSNDVQEVEMSIISTFEVVFKDPLIIIFHLIALFSLSFDLTLFVVLLLPVSGVLIGRLGKNLRMSARKGQKKLGLIISIIEESISGLRIIKAFNAEEKTYRQFSSVNNFFNRIMIKVFRRKGLASPLSEFLGTIVMVVVIYYGSNLVLKSNGEMNPEDLIGFILLFYMIIGPSKQVSTAFYNIQKGMASLDRINKILNAPITIIDKNDAKSITEFKSSIEFRDVSFKYEKEFVLNNINVKIKKGQSIALVGQSGSGKSTMADLIPRFIDVVKGELFLDGIPLRDYITKDIRNLMGIVTQESILFNDSIFNNIAYGVENATEEDVIRAAKVANAHEFIMKLRHDYYTNIGDRGHKLSGGQRQRISIARAVLKNPPILILDEATSSLDTESEKLVQDALNSLMENRTSIIIAHRLSTIQNADEILVLENGYIVERGKHEELIAFNGVYKKLVDLQNFK